MLPERLASAHSEDFGSIYQVWAGCVRKLLLGQEHLSEVNIPGAYPLLNDKESLASLIKRSGGLSSKALDNGISIYREKTYFEDPPEDEFLSQLQTQTNFEEPSPLPEIENDKIKLVVVDQGSGFSEKDTNKIHESADVLYHLIVYLEANNIKIEDVMKELEKRKKNDLR